MPYGTGEDFMRLRDLAKIVDANTITGEELLDEIMIARAFAADLMSDVLAFATGGSLLLTGLTNPQVVRTVEMTDISAILFVRGKVPLQETIDLAKSKGIPLLTTKYILFETCGRLFQAGIGASIEKVD
jgi:predicted transcriptional regulator